MESQVCFEIPASRLFKCVGGLLCFLSYSNLLFGCVNTFACEELLPSFSYFAGFPGHDRLTVLCTTLFSLSLVLLSVTLHAESQSQVSSDTRVLVLGIGLSLSVFVSIAGVIDGHTGLHGPSHLSYIHYYSVYILLILSSTWFFLVLTSFPLSKRIYRYLLPTFFLLLLTFLQWELGYSYYQNILINPYLFAVWEWATLTLAVFLPYQVCEAGGNFRIKLGFEAN